MEIRTDGTGAIGVSRRAGSTPARDDRSPLSPFNLHSCAIDRERSLSVREIDALEKWRRRRHSREEARAVAGDYLDSRHSRSIRSTVADAE